MSSPECCLQPSAPQHGQATGSRATCAHTLARSRTSARRSCAARPSRPRETCRSTSGPTPVRPRHPPPMPPAPCQPLCTSHTPVPSGERPFRCPFEGCGRSFTTSNIRKVHVRTHTGERPYTCPEPHCGRGFTSATNYKNHVRIHTGGPAGMQGPPPLWPPTALPRVILGGLLPPPPPRSQQLHMQHATPPCV